MTTSPPRRKRPAKASPTTATVAAVTHPDAAELRPGQSIALLQELHLLRRKGRLNQDARRKLKQVYHLYQFIEPLLQECAGAVEQEDGKKWHRRGAFSPSTPKVRQPPGHHDGPFAYTLALAQRSVPYVRRASGSIRCNFWRL